MCGISGIISCHDMSPRPFLDKMLDTIIYRGPDDSGIYSQGSVGIGMRRLSIIDVKGGHQPLRNEDGSIWVVNNGEIYNFLRLKSELIGRGHTFYTRSDTEVIVHAYEEFGLDFLSHLDGMFGLALWDANNKMLVIARDRLGIKPLYYHTNKDTLIFASEVKALLATEIVSAEMDDEALQNYLAMGFSVAPLTLFKGIKKLAPGEFLVWKAGDAELNTYWRPPDETHSDLSTNNWVEQTRDELKRTITDHMISDVPLGAFLSGGIDSSAIVGLMNENSTEAVKTYSIGYAGSSVASYYNELPFAKQVAQIYRTDHHEIPVAPNVADLLPMLMWHLEEPISDTATITTYLVAQFAAKSVKVIMSGVGGDELFAGYRRYMGDFYHQKYFRIPRWIRTGMIEPVIGILPSGRNNRLVDLSRYAKHFVRSTGLEWNRQYRNYVQLENPDVLNRILPNGLILPDSFDRLTDSITARDPLLQLMQVDLRSQLPEALLLLTDKITMATSLECRVPFLDHHLVELAAKIPNSIKMKSGELKSILKQSVADLLPADILNRRKRGFGAPFGTWIKSELKPLRNHLINRKSVEQRGMFSWQAIRSICENHDQTREDYTDLLMVLMNIEIWNRIYIDRESPEDISADLNERLQAA